MGAGLRAGAKAPDKPPDPKAGAPVLDSTKMACLSINFECARATVRRL